MAQDSLTIAIFAGLGGMLGWGFADFFAKKTIDRIGDISTLFWSLLIGVIPILGIFLVNPEIPQMHHFDPLFFVLLGVVSAMSYLILYNGFGKGEVSLLSPIFASFAALVVILSALLFGETIPESQQIAIIIVFIGLLLISSDPRDIRKVLKVKTNRVKGVPQVLIAMVMYSFWLVFLDRFISGKSWVFYLLVIRSIAALTLLIYAITRGHNLGIKDKSLWKFLICIGVFDVAAFSFVSWGFSNTTHTSIVAMLSATFSLPTILLARIFLKEKFTPLQAVASITILVGIALVSLNIG